MFRIGNFLSHRLLLTSLATAGLAYGATSAHAQQFSQGFEKAASTTVVTEELARQIDFWIMEVQIKPMRMVWVDLPHPETGELSREQIWYLPWRAIRRPAELAMPADVNPVNQLDPLPGPMQFIPEFTLTTYGSREAEVPEQVLTDSVLPQAMNEIRRIERGNYLDTVSVVQDLPEVTAPDSEDQPWIYGVATFRGVDPNTRFFNVIMAGFSNGYEVRQSGNTDRQIWRKVLLQKYYRPGDRFDPNQAEFQFHGNMEWIFQPDPDDAGVVASK